MTEPREPGGGGGQGMAAVLLLASKLAYHTDDFLAAAARLGVPCVLGTDRCHVLAAEWPEGALALRFRDPDDAVETIVAAARARPIGGIVPTDEVTAVIAARAAARLGLRFNPVEAARIAGNKRLLRERLAAAGLVQPGMTSVPVDADAAAAGAAMARAGLGFPVVLKPLHLSASRGVMRVDDRAGLAAGLARLAALLGDPEVRARDPGAAGEILIESFVPGREVAYEGLLAGGALRTLAIFDKPDPLDGPFFPETIYVTPSREAPAVQAAIARDVAAAAHAIGLREGPVHAELRLAAGARDTGGIPRPVVLEVAARSIGGLCHRTLRFGAGIALEELLILHAMGRATGRDLDALAARAAGASGVLMLPVPGAGVLRAVRGVDAARALPGVRDVVITARPGDVLVPLPEGHTYVGFLFATGADPALVTDTLRRAGACIALDMVTRL